MFHLVTGGSGSGKSSFAEAEICRIQEQTGAKHLYYIATMYPYGHETEEKIKRHRSMRAGKGFQTIECYKKLSKLLHSQWFWEDKQQEGICVLLECMSNLTANELYLETVTQREKDTLCQRVGEEIGQLSKCCRGMVVVTNEVFSDGEKYTPEMEEYRKILGEINQKMAETADAVSEIVYGIEVKIKG